MVLETGIVKELPVYDAEFERDRKNKVRFKFRQQFLDIAKQLRNMRVTPDMLMDGNVFPSIPFFRGDVAKEFFEHVKEGKLP